MHFALKAAVAVLAGVGVGLATTWAMVVGNSMPGGVKDGPWRTSTEIGAKSGSMYVRAEVALHGLLALSRDETIYYTATTDSSGSPLNGSCSYRVMGRDPDARWWSITAYGGDDYLIANPQNRYSISKTMVQRKPDGSFDAEISRRPGADNWVPVTEGPFSLTLRLYNPGKDVSQSPARAALPVIRRWACT